MKKLLILLLCLCLLTGCTLPSLPFRLPRLPFRIPSLPFISSNGSPAPTATALPEAAPTAAPATITSAPTQVPVQAETKALPDQAYAGTCLRFEVPGSWAMANMDDGVRFLPDDSDGSTFLFYQEVDNEMKLTEAAVDMALLFSSDASLASLAEKFLTSSGRNDVKLSSVSVKKAKLNGLSCYRGAATVAVEGTSYEFAGHVFLRKDKIALLVWVGDEAAYAAALDAVYASVQAIE